MVTTSREHEGPGALDPAVARRASCSTPQGLLDGLLYTSISPARAPAPRARGVGLGRRQGSDGDAFRAPSRVRGKAIAPWCPVRACEQAGPSKVLRAPSPCCPLAAPYAAQMGDTPCP